MLTILLNAKVEKLESFQHLKWSIESSKSISDDWLVNIRGKYRQKALKYLRTTLRDALQEFELLDDDRGWNRNSLDMINKSKNDYILVFNIDHANVAPQSRYVKIIEELDKKNIDYLPYSWWHFGKFREAFDKSGHLRIGSEIDHLHLTQSRWQRILKKEHEYYLISMCGIFKRQFLEQLLSGKLQTFPIEFTYFVFFTARLLSKVGIKLDEQKYFQDVNRLLDYKLRKYDVSTPFELEKGPERVDILPLNYAIPKYELFACIDDDLGVANYQLQKRKNFSRKSSLNIKNDIKKILAEINKVLKDVNQDEVLVLIEDILRARRVVCYGAGRVGYATKAFTMRLKHLGSESYFMGDSNLPSLEDGDLLLVCSGSGETQTTYNLTKIAHDRNIRIALITSNPQSRIGRLASNIVQINAPTKLDLNKNFKSIQPMTTLYEQCLWIFFDALVLEIMKKERISEDFMRAKHSVLE
jgi:6-phospho-3-hexuloisomerase